MKDATKHSWDSYVKYAMGLDELMPISQRGKNTFGGLGATVVDSLDTLWIMGLKEEYQKGRDWVDRDLTFDK